MSPSNGWPWSGRKKERRSKDFFSSSKKLPVRIERKKNQPTVAVRRLLSWWLLSISTTVTQNSCSVAAEHCQQFSTTNKTFPTVLPAVNTLNYGLQGKLDRVRWPVQLRSTLCHWQPLQEGRKQACCQLLRQGWEDPVPPRADHGTSTLFRYGRWVDHTAPRRLPVLRV